MDRSTVAPPISMMMEAIGKGDEDAYDAACAQFSLDSTNFLNGDRTDKIDTSDLDYLSTSIVDWYAVEDEIWLNEWLTHDEDSVAGDQSTEIIWDSCEARYSRDSAAWPAEYATYEGAALQYTADSLARATNVNTYTQIWSQGQADTDANNALHNWLNVCSPPVLPTVSLSGCCLHIVMDTNARDFGTPLQAMAASAETVGGWDSVGYPSCDDTSACPYYARYIQLNISGTYLYQTTDPSLQQPSPLYALHSVPKWGFFTSPSSAPSLYSGYKCASFYPAHGA